MWPLPPAGSSDFVHGNSGPQRPQQKLFILLKARPGTGSASLFIYAIGQSHLRPAEIQEEKQPPSWGRRVCKNLGSSFICHREVKQLTHSHTANKSPRGNSIQFSLTLQPTLLLSSSRFFPVKGTCINLHSGAEEAGCLPAQGQIITKDLGPLLSPSAATSPSGIVGTATKGPTPQSQNASVPGTDNSGLVK